MPSITRDIVAGYLSCPFKAHLKVTGESETPSDYLTMVSETHHAIHSQVIASLGGCQDADPIDHPSAITSKELKQGKPFFFDAVVADEPFFVCIDGLARVDQPSRLGAFHYVPMLFIEGTRPHREHRRLLGVLGHLLERIQGKAPAYGLVWLGKDRRRTKVRLGNKSDNVEQLIADLRQIHAGASTPPLILNDHCAVCEFRARCRKQALAEDNLSLLRGIGPKEIKRLARKGIFSLNQLSHTFRPRRKGKRPQLSHSRQYALQAMAIRDKAVYVLGEFDIPQKPVKLYLDIEGDSAAKHTYLIGLIAEEGGRQEHSSFWADDDDEQTICGQFLRTVAEYRDFTLFFYGSYEQTFLRRLQKNPAWKDQADRLLLASFNVLSPIYGHIYFPTYSNGLKDVAGLFGCHWTDPDASGIQSMVWRAKWKESHDAQLKQNLIRYNLEDCLALREVVA